MRLIRISKIAQWDKIVLTVQLLIRGNSFLGNITVGCVGPRSEASSVYVLNTFFVFLFLCEMGPIGWRLNRSTFNHPHSTITFFRHRILTAAGRRSMGRAPPNWHRRCAETPKYVAVLTGETGSIHLKKSDLTKLDHMHSNH